MGILSVESIQSIKEMKGDQMKLVSKYKILIHKIDVNYLQEAIEELSKLNPINPDHPKHMIIQQNITNLEHQLYT